MLISFLLLRSDKHLLPMSYQGQYTRFPDGGTDLLASIAYVDAASSESALNHMEHQPLLHRTCLMAHG
ncbi:MAG TPA: hypothetical protein DEV97_08890 [Lachnospiraceae bacterium]|nr:hypothetical protein [Lachnospiraceae bacterium]